MKKLVTALMIMLLAGCSGGNVNKEITVVSREDGSGTRSAFTELMKIEKDGVENITEYAEIANSTSVVVTSVAGNANAVGYVSVGCLSDSVKAVKIDGITPTAENIGNGAYPIARNFNIVTKNNTNTTADDFMSFIMSSNGQSIISDEGYIPVQAGEEYANSHISGSISIAGSTSVAPVMEKLADAYRKYNPDVTIEIQQTGSSAGIMSVTEGISDIGMSSRELTEKEKNSGLQNMVIALDGIAVIVNNDNTVDNLTSEQVRGIFSGDIREWNQIKESDVNE